MGFFDSLFGDKQKKESTSTQTGDQSYGLTPEVKKYWESISSMYGPNAWSTVDPNQYQQAASQAMAGYASGLNPAVAGAMGIGATGLDPNSIARYQSPYTQQVIDASLRDMDDANSRQNASINANAAKLGALSGTQPLVARDLAAGRQADARNSMIANLRNQGFNTAAGLAGQDVNARLSGLGAAGSLIGQQAGITNQSFGQGTQLWNQAWQNAMMPYQLAQQGAQTLSGLIPGSGQHTSGTATGTETSTASPSPFSAILGGIGAAAKIYGMMPSDERIKEDIAPIGETYDGQPIYKYRFKGSPQTEIGLLAQDVEQRHPEAVGSIAGLKTVNYDEATREAERPRKASGGSVGGNDPHQRLVSAFEAVHGMLHKARGGSVLRPRFADGGDVALGDWGGGTTVTPAPSGFDFGRAGDELSGLSKKMQRPQSQGDGDMLGAQQRSLSQMLSGMGGARPGFADGGFAGEWDESGPMFKDRPGEVSGLGTPMFVGIGGDQVSRSQLPQPREPMSPSINPPITSSTPTASRGTVSGAPLDKGWFGNFMDRLTKPRDINERPSRLEDIGTMLMSVKSPRFNAPFEGMASHAIQQNQARMEERRIDNEVARMLGELNGRPTLDARRVEADIANAKRAREMQEAGLTGVYNGQQTVDARRVDADIANAQQARKIQEASVTGVYDGQQTVAGRTAESNMQTAEMQREMNQLKLDEAKHPERIYERREALANKHNLQGDQRTQFIFDGKIPDRSAGDVIKEVNGKLVRVPQTGDAKMIFDAGPDFSKTPEFALKSAAFASRMIDAEGNLRKAMSDPNKFDPTSASAAAAAWLPEGAANFFVRSEDHQKYMQAAEQWIRAFLRKESGAAIGKDEFARDFKVYFPQPGDTPETIRQKEQARLNAVRGFAEESRGYFDHAHGEQSKQVKDWVSARNPQAGGSGGASAPAALPRITNDDDYNKLPSGAVFIGPDGRERRKP